MNLGAEIWNLVRKNGVKTTLNNNIDMSQANTQYLVADYLEYRLQKHGFSWQNCPPLNSRHSKVHNALKNLADNFNERYHAEFDSMVQQLNSDIAYPTFLAVANELFIDGKNWGRVVALFVFGGAIAEECVDKHMEHLVDSINEWLVQYIQNCLDPWISAQGGWSAMELKTLIWLYIKFKLREDGLLNGQQFPVLEGSENDILSTAIAMCFEIEQDPNFPVILASLRNFGVERETFRTVIEQLLVGELNWHRVMSVVSLAGALSIEYAQRGDVQKIDLIQDWAGVFAQEKMNSWMKANGGLDGLVAFYESSPEKNHESPWSLSLGKIFIGAVGVLALGAVLTQKS